jgi:hypothetical protein
MAKFTYYCSKGFKITDYSGIDAEDITTSENGSMVVLPDDKGQVKAIIHLAPGDRLERTED